MSEVRLQVRNIVKNFGITRALKDVSFDVNKGEVHALIGENGSGKSTLTNMLTGIYPMETGKFILDGQEIHPNNQVEANNLGISIIVQELGTLSGLTVAENIFLGHEDRFITKGFRNKVAMNAEANRLLKEYGFDHIKGGSMVDDYNFEDRKLVEIVKATYFHPKIVVIDETTTALSQEGREELYKQMERLKSEGCTVIFISHDLSLIRQVSSRISVLCRGRLAESGETRDVCSDPWHPYTKMLLNSVLPPDPLKAGKVRPVFAEEGTQGTDSGKGCPFAASCGYAMKCCFEETPGPYRFGSRETACFLYSEKHTGKRAEGYTMTSQI